jgi:hypothetical protein
MFRALLGALALACAAPAAMAATSVGLQVLTYDLSSVLPTAADWERFAFPSANGRPVRVEAQPRPASDQTVLDPAARPASWTLMIAGVGFAAAALGGRRRKRRLVMPGALVSARRGGRRLRNP